MWFAEFWTGVLGTHPGSGTGTQTIEAFHAFWQKLLTPKLRHSPVSLLPLMQKMFEREWRCYLAADDAVQSSPWPIRPDPTFMSGTALRRIGQNSAAEYWQARALPNYQERSLRNATFWVMQAESTGKEQAANAKVSEQFATQLVHLITAAGHGLKQALKESGVFEGEVARVSTTTLKLLFQEHCVVFEGELPASRWPRCYARGQSEAPLLLCTCLGFGQRAECQHVYFVKGLKGQMKLDGLPQRKPGRPRAA
jgi:hypothetical protein